MKTKLIFLAFLSLVALTPLCPAQHISVRACFKEERYNELLKAFDQWNSKIAFEKKSFEPDFEKEIKEQALFHPPGWDKKRLDLWRSLPNLVSPTLPLASDAQLLLISLYDENAEEFTQTYEKGRREDQIKMKLALILGLAQKAANEANASTIHSSHVFQAVADSWTGLYPLCPRHKPR